jgi:hypothetical protein
MTAQAQRRQDRADPRLDDLREFWCSDCAGVSLFERPPLDHTGVAGGEWSCTACGAAYMDGIDRLVEMIDARSGAA